MEFLRIQKFPVIGVPYAVCGERREGMTGEAGARAAGGVSVLSLSGFVSGDVPRLTEDRQHPGAYSLGFYDFPVALFRE